MLKRSRVTATNENKKSRKTCYNQQKTFEKILFVNKKYTKKMNKNKQISVINFFFIQHMETKLIQWRKIIEKWIQCWAGASFIQTFIHFSWVFFSGYRKFISMIDELISVLLENQEHFRCDQNGSEFLTIIQSMIETVNKLGTSVEDVKNFAANYDADESTPGNGYRSFVVVVEKALKKAFEICTKIQENRGKFLFRRKFYEKWDD